MNVLLIYDERNLYAFGTACLEERKLIPSRLRSSRYIRYLSVRIPKVGTYLYLVTHGQQDHTPANVNTLHVHARIQYSTNPVNFGTLPAHSPSKSNTAIAMIQTSLI